MHPMVHTNPSLSKLESSLDVLHSVIDVGVAMRIPHRPSLEVNPIKKDRSALKSLPFFHEHIKSEQKKASPSNALVYNKTNKNKKRKHTNRREGEHATARQAEKRKHITKENMEGMQDHLV